MKTLGGIIGAVLIIGSFVLFFIAFALSARPDAPVGFIVIVGILSLIIGIVLDRSADRKVCPQCAETVKLKANVCRYCAHQFV